MIHFDEYIRVAKCDTWDDGKDVNIKCPECIAGMWRASTECAIYDLCLHWKESEGRLHRPRCGLFTNWLEDLKAGRCLCPFGCGWCDKPIADTGCGLFFESWWTNALSEHLMEVIQREPLGHHAAAFTIGNGISLSG